MRDAKKGEGVNKNNKRQWIRVEWKVNMHVGGQPTNAPHATAAICLEGST